MVVDPTTSYSNNKTVHWFLSLHACHHSRHAIGTLPNADMQMATYIDRLIFKMTKI